MTTLTVEMRDEAEARLDELARHTNRSKSDLAGAAIADYVDRELEIIEGIKRGLADMKAGRVTPHDEVMRQLDATIERAAREYGAE